MEVNQQSIVIGAGLGGLTAAALLAHAGKKPLVIEQNWIPGGCATSYPRKNVIFESGATTLVGLDKGMALYELLRKLNLNLPAQKLKIPMRVVLSDGTLITRFQDKEEWIAEAERVFGPKGQRAFWEFSFKLSDFVWRVSGKYLNFPPSKLSDFAQLAKSFHPADLPFLRYIFFSEQTVLKRFGLADNKRFVDFCNEQLLISAQNHIGEVNALFASAALCYTQLGNYYMPGGMGKISELLCDYISSEGGLVMLRNKVKSIQFLRKNQFKIQTEKGEYNSPLLVSGIPLNNLYEIDQTGKAEKYRTYLMEPERLYSAFQAGIVFKAKHYFDCLHHQIHLKTPFLGTEAASVFVSLSHPDDELRAPNGQCVASVSMHIRHPHKPIAASKAEMEKAVLNVLIEHGFFNEEDVIYMHSSQQKSWEKWTGRKWGFVGGYPQYMDIKPWQMKDARHPCKGFYLCGDSIYPGQGIPGTVLSGFCAFEKAKTDGYI